MGQGQWSSGMPKTAPDGANQAAVRGSRNGGEHGPTDMITRLGTAQHTAGAGGLLGGV